VKELSLECSFGIGQGMVQTETVSIHARKPLRVRLTILTLASPTDVPLIREVEGSDWQRCEFFKRNLAGYRAARTDFAPQSAERLQISLRERGLLVVVEYPSTSRDARRCTPKADLLRKLVWLSSL